MVMREEKVVEGGYRNSNAGQLESRGRSAIKQDVLLTVPNRL